MPKALERRLEAEAKARGYTGERKDKYVFGTLRKIEERKKTLHNPVPDEAKEELSTARSESQSAEAAAENLSESEAIEDEPEDEQLADYIVTALADIDDRLSTVESSIGKVDAREAVEQELPASDGATEASVTPAPAESKPDVTTVERKGKPNATDDKGRKRRRSLLF